MKFHEKLQYKMKRIIYEKNRKKKQHTKYEEFKTEMPNGQESMKNKVNTALEEMDTCIGEILESINIPKIKK